MSLILFIGTFISNEKHWRSKVSSSLLQCHCSKRFLYQLVTVDDEWDIAWQSMTNVWIVWRTSILHEMESSSSASKESSSGTAYDRQLLIAKIQLFVNKLFSRNFLLNLFVTGSRVCQAEFVVSTECEVAFEIWRDFCSSGVQTFQSSENIILLWGEIKNLAAAAAAFNDNWGLT